MSILADGNGGHSELLAFGQIDRGIVNEETIRWGFAHRVQSDLEGLGLRFAIGLQGIDIDDLGETVSNIEQFQHPFGMAAIRIGEDEFRQGKVIQNLGQIRLGTNEVIQWDGVNVFQIGIHVHLKFRLEPPQCGAIGAPEAIADSGNVISGEVQLLAHVLLDSVADLLPKAAIVRVDRVIQVKEDDFVVFNFDFVGQIVHRAIIAGMALFPLGGRTQKTPGKKLIYRG